MRGGDNKFLKFNSNFRDILGFFNHAGSACFVLIRRDFLLIGPFVLLCLLYKILISASCFDTYTNNRFVFITLCSKYLKCYCE